MGGLDVKLELDEPDGGSESEESEEELEVPVAARKLYNSFAGMPQLLTGSQTRNGKPDGHSIPGVNLYAEGERKESPWPLPGTNLNAGWALTLPPYMRLEHRPNSLIGNPLSSRTTRGIAGGKPLERITVFETEIMVKKKIDGYGRIET